jgi:hypothetical protein
MNQGGVERRRARRASLEAQLIIRRLGGGPVEETMTKNIGLGGVYFEADADPAYTVSEMLMAFVSIPESQRHDFPFTRLAGLGRVVRIQELPAPGAEGQKRMGVALEFGSDLTALTAPPAR